MKIGTHVGVWVKYWDCDYPYFIEKAARLGFNVLELNAVPFITMPKDKANLIKRAADSSGIELTFCGGLKPASDVASPDQRKRKQGIDDIIRMSETVYEMGGSFLSGILHGVWPHIVDTILDDKSDFLKYSADSVREAAIAVEDMGITFNLEIVNRFEQFLINTADEGLSFIEQIGRPNIKLLLDIFHMNIEEDSISDALHKTGPLLGHVHMSENNRMPPHPKGQMNWNQIIGDLKAINYEGVLVMEPFVQMGGEVGQALRIWRNLTDHTDEASLDQLVSESLQYIRSLIAE